MVVLGAKAYTASIFSHFPSLLGLAAILRDVCRLYVVFIGYLVYGGKVVRRGMDRRVVRVDSLRN